MKKVIVKSITGDLLDKHQAEDPMPWLVEGIKNNRWGLAERVKKVKECTRFELANVLRIQPPDDVVIAADYKFEIVDMQSETLEKEKARQKRKDLVRDWSALNPTRRARITDRILTYILEHNDVEVSDL